MHKNIRSRPCPRWAVYPGLWAIMMLMAGAVSADPIKGKSPRYDHDIFPVANHASIYNSMAQFVHDDFANGDLPRAQAEARILEIAWDRCEKNFCKSNADVWKQVDEAMDAFIGPILNPPSGTADPAAVEAAFKNYGKKLRLIPRLPYY